MNSLGFFALAILASADAPRFEATVASQVEPIVGELVTLNIGGLSATANQLIEVRQVGIARPMPPWDRPHVLLANGDRWLGHLIAIADDQVQFMAELSGKQQLTIPLNAIVGVWMTPPKQNVEPQASDLDIASRRRTTDEVHLSNGDLIRATILEMKKGVIFIDAAGTEKQFPVERVSALLLNSELTRHAIQKVQVAKIICVNGSRLTLTDAGLQDGRLVGKTAGDQTARVLLADIAQVAIIGGKAIYLSELPAKNFKHTPYLNFDWPLARNRNTSGSWIRLGADAFDRGIGLHSQSTVVYDVPNDAGRFEAWVGMDAVVGARGHVVVTAHLDSQAVFGPSELSGGQLAKRIAVAIPEGSRELSLKVEFGHDADVQDHVNWADARFIRRR